MVQPMPVLRVQQPRPQLALVWELLHVRSVPLAAPVPAVWGGLRGGGAHRAVHSLLTLEPRRVRFHSHRGGCWEMPPGRVRVLFLYRYGWDQGFGSVFIWYGSGSGSSILGWTRSGSNPNPGFLWPKIEKKYTAKKNNFFGSRTIFYLSLSFSKGRPGHKRSLLLSKENIQHFKTWYLNFFLLLSLCGSLSLLDPDPDSEYGSGSTNLIDPDPIRIPIRNPGWDNIFWFPTDPYHFVLDGVSDPDPGSGAFLTPGSGIRYG